MPTGIEWDGANIDLHRRFLQNSTVVGSPAAAAETTIASLTINDSFPVVSGVYIEVTCAFTVGTNGTAVTLKIHQTNSSGSTLYSSGAVTATAANLMNMSAQAFDASPTLPGQIYIATLQVTNGSATSTVSALSIFCTVI